MSERSTHHATFTIERTYKASPKRVFAAWADSEAKLRWFACHDDWERSGHELDFRAGGRERLRSGPPGGTVHAFDATFHDIVENERIVFAYDLHLDERLISVSLVTIVLVPAGAGSRLTLTEQGVFLDGWDDVAGREEGTRIGLYNLALVLEREEVHA